MLDSRQHGISLIIQEESWNERRYYLFACNSGHEPEVIEAMKKAIQNPTEDTIFELSSTVEANAFKAGVRSCLQMMHCLFIEE